MYCIKVEKMNFQNFNDGISFFFSFIFDRYIFDLMIIDGVIFSLLL
jgi:hypothetical protein